MGGKAVDRQFLAVTNRLEGGLGPTQAVGRAHHHHKVRAGGYPATPSSAGLCAVRQSNISAPLAACTGFVRVEVPGPYFKPPSALEMDRAHGIWADEQASGEDDDTGCVLVHFVVLCGDERQIFFGFYSPPPSRLPCPPHHQNFWSGKQCTEGPTSLGHFWYTIFWFPPPPPPPHTTPR